MHIEQFAAVYQQMFYVHWNNVVFGKFYIVVSTHCSMSYYLVRPSISPCIDSFPVNDSV